jgi:hypothetical protein
MAKIGFRPSKRTKNNHQEPAAQTRKTQAYLARQGEKAQKKDVSKIHEFNTITNTCCTRPAIHRLPLPHFWGPNAFGKTFAFVTEDQPILNRPCPSTRPSGASALRMILRS